MTRCAFQIKPSEKNRSDRIGVFRRDERPGRAAVWVASWMDLQTGKLRRSEFSVLRWGEQDAREQAKKARDEAEIALAEALGNPGVGVTRCLSDRLDGWQVRWWEPVSDGYARTSLFFGTKKHGGVEAAEAAAQAFAARLRERLGLDKVPERPRKGAKGLGL